MSELFTTLDKRVGIHAQIKEELNAELDAFVHFNQITYPHLKLSKSDIIHELIKRGLESRSNFMSPFRKWLLTDDGKSFVETYKQEQEQAAKAKYTQKATRPPQEEATPQTEDITPKPKPKFSRELVDKELSKKTNQEVSS